MKKLITKYINKLYSQKLANKDKIFFLGLDDSMFFNRTQGKEVLELYKIFKLMDINSILFAEPAEPYKSIINELVKDDYSRLAKSQKNWRHINARHLGCKFDCNPTKKIIPMDCESRTFLHDIPIVDYFSADLLAGALSERKSAIVKGLGIISYGTVTSEQAFVSFSSTCFAVYVKYFVDAINYFEHCISKKTAPEKRFLQAFNRIAGYVKRYFFNTFNINLAKTCRQNFSDNPIQYLKKTSSLVSEIIRVPMNEDEVIRTLAKIGKIIVNLRLVDSFFGNISYVFGNNIFISQTGASMDELESCIDKVPIDGSSSAGITSSSELPTHLRIYFKACHRAILHAHPRFSVIMSMHCQFKDCPYFHSRLLCHTDCIESRNILGISVVAGEIGTGRTSIVNTVPEAVEEIGGAIVYGHGVFTSGKEDFGQALSSMINIEMGCYMLYFKKVNEYFNYWRWRH